MAESRRYEAFEVPIWLRFILSYVGASAAAPLPFLFWIRVDGSLGQSDTIEGFHALAVFWSVGFFYALFFVFIFGVPTAIAIIRKGWTNLRTTAFGPKRNDLTKTVRQIQADH